MNEIKSSSDFQAGATLVVRIPEGELDEKALYTILSSQPSFILPFRHMAVDGQIEFTYLIGKRSKLAYFSSDRTPDDYADLWSSILQPLLDCEDWFMNPYSFVLDPEYLYYDKNSKSVSYVYIPSTKACSDYGAMKGMVTDIAKRNHVTDISLENKVVWAIQDLNIIEFLQTVKPQKAPGSMQNAGPKHGQAMGQGQGRGAGREQGQGTGREQEQEAGREQGQGAGREQRQRQAQGQWQAQTSAPAQEQGHGQEQGQGQAQASVQSQRQQSKPAQPQAAAQRATPPKRPAPSWPGSRPPSMPAASAPKAKAPMPTSGAQANADDFDIVINIPAKSYPAKSIPAKSNPAKNILAKSIPAQKASAQKDDPGIKKWGISSLASLLMKIGSGEAGQKQAPMSHSRKNGKKTGQPAEIIQGAAAAPQQPAPARGQPATIYDMPTDFDNDVTHIDVPGAGVPKFRYIGKGKHPSCIEVNLPAGGIFRIGRFDVTVGNEQQPDFVFDRKTRAVSRKHAAVERGLAGYSIVDLHSTFGTFVDEKMLTPNIPAKLERGSLVSFGHKGADYVWEE